MDAHAGAPGGAGCGPHDDPAIGKRYPEPLYTHDYVARTRAAFFQALSVLGQQLSLPQPRTPRIGGVEVDLHPLYVHVTNLGGLNRVTQDKKWKGIAVACGVPESTANLGALLRKSYARVLHHFEQVYYFRTHGLATPAPSALVIADPMLGLAAANGAAGGAGANGARAGRPGGAADADPASQVGQKVVGTVDGRFDFGYFVSVTIGREQYKGILYQPSAWRPGSAAAADGAAAGGGAGGGLLAPMPAAFKKKSSHKKRLAKERALAGAPKAPRTAFNYFSADLRDATRAQYPGCREHDISRLLGEQWRGLSKESREVYDARARADKQRHEAEAAAYQASAAAAMAGQLLAGDGGGDMDDEGGLD